MPRVRDTFGLLTGWSVKTPISGGESSYLTAHSGANSGFSEGISRVGFSQLGWCTGKGDLNFLYSSGSTGQVKEER